MSFPRALTSSEMQSASSMIWNRITDSIFYNDNTFTKRASLFSCKVGQFSRSINHQTTEICYPNAKTRFDQGWNTFPISLQIPLSLFFSTFDTMQLRLYGLVRKNLFSSLRHSETFQSQKSNHFFFRLSSLLWKMFKLSVFIVSTNSRLSSKNLFCYLLRAVSILFQSTSHQTHVMY